MCISDRDPSAYDGGEILVLYQDGSCETVTCPDTAALEETLARLSAREDVALVQPNYTYAVSYTHLESQSARRLAQAAGWFSPVCSRVCRVFEKFRGFTLDLEHAPGAMLSPESSARGGTGPASTAGGRRRGRHSPKAAAPGCGNRKKETLL